VQSSSKVRKEQSCAKSIDFLNSEAFCRTYRRGQDKQTQMTRFVVRGTVEPELVKMQEKKDTEISTVLSDEPAMDKKYLHHSIQGGYANDHDIESARRSCSSFSGPQARTPTATLSSSVANIPESGGKSMRTVMMMVIISNTRATCQGCASTL